MADLIPYLNRFYPRHPSKKYPLSKRKGDYTASRNPLIKRSTQIEVEWKKHVITLYSKKYCTEITAI
jgi:hypothetical protein